jgi:hypothetical protein
VLSSLVDRSDTGALPGSARLHAVVLQEALDDLGTTIASFPGFGGLGRREALARYAARHCPPDARP